MTKGTSKVCGSSGDGVTGFGQRDAGYWQRVWFFWGWENRDEGYYHVFTKVKVISWSNILWSRSNASHIFHNNYLRITKSETIFQGQI